MRNGQQGNDEQPRQVAIACQGGGTHAAFTWGVLTEILRTKQAWDKGQEDSATFDVVAVSGTSAGALCALATWYGLTPNRADPACGTIDKAIERLDCLWSAFAAATPVEHAHNALVKEILHYRENGLPFLDASPYENCGEVVLKSLEMLGARPPYLGFTGLLAALCPDFADIDWHQAAKIKLRILVAAIEIVSGNFELFDSDKSLQEMGLANIAKDENQYEETRWRMRRPLSLEGVAASGTLPELLPAQEIHDVAFPTCEPGKTVRRTGYYWDGLYSQNPPVRDLMRVRDKDHKPDEIWVIRINPQEYHPEDPCMRLSEIRDRANDLAGNLSLNQELDHILTVNRWLTRHRNDLPMLRDFKPIDVRTIKMTYDTVRQLCLSSKFDRSPRHISHLHDEGQSVARQWLQDWRALGPDFATYPNDARYPASV